MSTEKEVREIIPSLTNWFQSQDISTKDAAAVSIDLLARLLSHLANDRKHLDEGISIACDIIKQRAVLYFDQNPK